MIAIMRVIIAACLLGASSLSVASPIQIFDTAGNASLGSLFLANGDSNVISGSFPDIAGDSTSLSSVFYDFRLQSSVGVNAGARNIVLAQEALALLAVGEITLSIFEDNGFFVNVFDPIDELLYTGVNSVSALLSSDTLYFLQLTGINGTDFTGEISAVPVPAAGILFASVLLGLGAIGRRKKKIAKTALVSVFARSAK